MIMKLCFIFHINFEAPYLAKHVDTCKINVSSQLFLVDYVKYGFKLCLNFDLFLKLDFFFKKKTIKALTGYYLYLQKPVYYAEISKLVYSIAEICETLEKVSVLTIFAESRKVQNCSLEKVSVSLLLKLCSLEKSQSRRTKN